MHIVVLGGTRFLGPYIVRELAAAGHELIVFHLGQHTPDFPGRVRTVLGDFCEFERHVEQLRRLKPEVVLDTAAFRAEEGRRVLALAGIARRSVVLSSCDVYRAFGRLLRTEPGEPDPIPLTEQSPLRARLSNTGERYNKTGVEREARSDATLPCTILRLPATHGPGDWQHRLYGYAKRIADRRPAILIDQSIWNWRWARGFVANVAHAVALAVSDDRATGRVYNVAELIAHTEAEWVRRIAEVMDYRGRILSAPTESLPQALRADIDSRQDFVVDSARVRSELGYTEIVDERTALRQTIDWELANPPEIKLGEFDYAAEDAAITRLG